MKKPLQGRVSNRTAEHSIGRIEAYNTEIAINRTENLVKDKEDQETDKMGRTAARHSVR